MPRLNQKGQALCGVGDGIVSVDRWPIIYRAGGGCWLDDHTVLANAFEDGKWQTVRCPLPEALVISIDDGANTLAAGGGRWLAWNAARGVYGSVTDVPRHAGVLPAGPDGTLAWCPNYDTGVGIVLEAPDGQRTEVPDAMVIDRDLQVLGPTSALWIDYRGGVRVVGRPPVRTALPAWKTRLVTLDDGDWLIYWSEGVGLIAQLDGATDGYVLETEPKAFNHDAVSGYGQIVVCWSTTQGERPNDLAWRLVDRKDPRVPLVKATPVPKPVPVPQPKPTPTPVPKPVPKSKDEPMLPPIGDDQIIELSQRWIARYQAIGRYQQQPPADNIRDEAYWIVVYARAREKGKDHEAAMRDMENGMAAEAGQPPPFPS